MPVRILAAVIAVFDCANGWFMILDPRGWFFHAPGATDTGPFNAHFVTDIGLGYVASGITLLAFTARPRWRLVAFGASLLLTFHGLFHLTHIASGHSGNALVDITIALPALLGTALCWPRRGDSHETARERALEVEV